VSLQVAYALYQDSDSKTKTKAQTDYILCHSVMPLRLEQIFISINAFYKVREMLEIIHWDLKMQHSDEQLHPKG
jgi:hypothetical protein